MSTIPTNLRWARKRLYDGVNNRLRTLGGARLASLCRPTAIQFLLTERCNARCVHCDIWKNRGQEDSPTEEQWAAALTDFRKWLGPVQITLTGGEALLKPFTIRLVEHGVQSGLFIELLTHGFWKDQTKIEALALANPWRVTLSFDGLGKTHDHVRGREGFFERTNITINTLMRVRTERQLGYTIRLKTVIMSHNIDGLEDVARYANQVGMEVLFQPIEQNYNTADDPQWYKHSENWPKDPEAAVKAIERLIQMKHDGFSIANTAPSLEVMKAYFRDPAALRVSTQAHSAHEKKASCAALALFQVQSNGDVRTCSSMPPIGNIKTESPREIWRKRPKWWISGCCMNRRMDEQEKQQRLTIAGAE